MGVSNGTGAYHTVELGMRASYLMLIRTLAGAEDVVNAGAVDKYLSGDDVNAAKSQKGIDSASGRGLAGHHEKWSVETRGVRGIYGLAELQI